jgi:hypothetical protein
VRVIVQITAAAPERSRWCREEVEMQDRTATMMIIRSLQDIADELKAVRQELHQMNRSQPRGAPDFRQGFSDESQMDDAFESLAQAKQRGR